VVEDQQIAAQPGALERFPQIPPIETGNGVIGNDPVPAGGTACGQLGGNRLQTPRLNGYRIASLVKPYVKNAHILYRIGDYLEKLGFWLRIKARMEILPQAYW
jgi:hypothetical protein